MIARVLAAASFVALEDRAVLARIAGPIGEAARVAYDRLVAMSPEARRDKRRTWAVASRAPVPPGLRGVDASWIEAALADLPPAARDALASGAITEVEVWLARSACAALPPMPPIDPAKLRPREVGDLARLTPAVLRAWLEDVGADQLAFALGSLAVNAAPVFGERLLVAAARIGTAPRAGALGQRRAAIDRARVDPDPVALLKIGARAVAPHTDSLLRRQITHRLARPIGLVVAREMRIYARTPVEDTPALAALFAVAHH
ncbi:MAG: hypothetical protein H0T42_14655 [Deltaproteobacteria bacterium]|nr:hypothetical protein [Deltaproteobacteria bacterium]